MFSWSVVDQGTWEMLLRPEWGSGNSIDQKKPSASVVHMGWRVFLRMQSCILQTAGCLLRLPGFAGRDPEDK